MARLHCNFSPQLNPACIACYSISTALSSPCAFGCRIPTTPTRSPFNRIRGKHMNAPFNSLYRNLSIGLLFLATPVLAQVGNNNPTGVSGVFNGNVTTGCSYDPYTGNAMRRVTDITVAGAVGSYGLSFSRISNSRSGFGNWFGMPGAWRHSYQWTVGDSDQTQ